MYEKQQKNGEFTMSCIAPPYHIRNWNNNRFFSYIKRPSADHVVSPFRQCIILLCFFTNKIYFSKSLLTVNVLHALCHGILGSQRWKKIIASRCHRCS